MVIFFSTSPLFHFLQVYEKVEQNASYNNITIVENLWSLQETIRFAPLFLKVA
jgi:hypothetical protein